MPTDVCGCDLPVVWVIPIVRVSRVFVGKLRIRSELLALVLGDTLRRLLIQPNFQMILRELRALYSARHKQTISD